MRAVKVTYLWLLGDDVTTVFSHFGAPAVLSDLQPIEIR